MFREVLASGEQAGFERAREPRLAVRLVVGLGGEHRIERAGAGAGEHEQEHEHCAPSGHGQKLHSVGTLGALSETYSS